MSSSASAQSPTIRFRTKQRSVIPGFGLSLGFTMFYLSLIVIMPLAALLFKTTGMGWGDFLASIAAPRAIAAYKVTFSCALIAALAAAFIGTLIAWVLVRYDFPFKKLADAMIDFPFALPTAVAGIALTALYAPDGLIGALFAKAGIKIAYTRAGIVVALLFIGLPFVVRTVQPILEDFDREMEEAAANLGATPIQIFLKIMLPNMLPGVIAGFGLAFARGLGEYGSVIFISSNEPMVSEIVPLLITVKLEQYDTEGAAAIALAMQVSAFFILLFINLAQKHTRQGREKL